MERELKDIIFNSVKALYSIYEEISIVKRIIYAGQVENRKVLERLGI